MNANKPSGPDKHGCCRFHTLNFQVDADLDAPKIVCLEGQETIPHFFEENES